MPSSEDSHRRYHPSRVGRREDICVWLRVLRLDSIVCTVPGFWSRTLCGSVWDLSYASRIHTQVPRKPAEVTGI